MKQFLLAHLICPACLPDEMSLETTAKRSENDDIITGELYCKKCKRRFPIRDGIATLLPDPERPTLLKTIKNQIEVIKNLRIF